MKLWNPNQIPSSGRADVGNRIPLWGRRFIQNASWRCRFVLSSKVEEHIFTLNLTLQPFSHTHSRMAIFYKCLNFWFTGFKWWNHSWLGARLQQGLPKDSSLNKQGRLSLENTFYIHIIFVGSITKYRKGLSTQVCKVDPIWATVVLVERTWRNAVVMMPFYILSPGTDLLMFEALERCTLSPRCAQRDIYWAAEALLVVSFCDLLSDRLTLYPVTSDSFSVALTCSQFRKIFELVRFHSMFAGGCLGAAGRSQSSGVFSFL